MSLTVPNSYTNMAIYVHRHGNISVCISNSCQREIPKRYVLRMTGTLSEFIRLMSYDSLHCPVGPHSSRHSC